MDTSRVNFKSAGNVIKRLVDAVEKLPEEMFLKSNFQPVGEEQGFEATMERDIAVICPITIHSSDKGISYIRIPEEAKDIYAGREFIRFMIGKEKYQLYLNHANVNERS